MTVQVSKVPDRRVARTQKLLRDALHSLIRERDYDSIAGDGLNERILWFSLPIFEHHDRHRRAGELRLGPRGRAVLHVQLQKVLVELIAEDIRKSLQGRRKAAGRIPPELLGRYVASTFILVLNWWVDSRSLLPAKEVNELFRTLILPTLGTASN